MSGYGLDYGGDGGYGGGVGVGGGFDTGGYQSPMASSPSQGNTKNYNDQTLIPVTIHMALTAQSAAQQGESDAFVLPMDGRSLHRVQIVGAVRSKEDSSTHILYTLEDGTGGLLQVKEWTDHHSSLPMSGVPVDENMYVKVIGQLKEYQNKRSLVAQQVRPLKTGNELAHHMLEVVYSSQKYLHKKQNPRQQQGLGGMMSYNNNPSPQFGAPPQQRGGVPLASAFGGDVNNNSNNPLHTLLLQFISQHDGDNNGADIRPCLRELTGSGRYTQHECGQALQALSALGTIYSTIDEDHYRMA